MKTSEWIASPEKLRENSRRAIERDKAQAEKARRDKKDKAQKIIIAVLFIAITGLLIRSINKMDADFMKDCTAGGNSVEFCQRAIDGQ